MHILSRDYSLSGDYRHVFVKPERMTWSTHRYDDVTESLVTSDLEKLRGESLSGRTEGNCFDNHQTVLLN